MKTYNIESFKDINLIDWNKIKKAEICEKGWTKSESFSSFGQIVFVENYGFLLKLTSLETSPWAIYKNDEDPVYLDSCLEAFLKLDESGYLNLETNSLGVRLQAFGKDRYNRKSLLSLSFNGFKVIPSHDKQSWSLLIDLPLSNLIKIYPSLKIISGFSFYGNFYKTGKNPNNLEEHYYMWNRIDTKNPDFHQPGQFGKFIVK